MKFSTKTTYGLRAIARLAKNYPAYLSLRKIAEKENISEKYLEQIFAKLKKGKLVVAEKGTAGGYKLVGDPREIIVYDIMKSLEGDAASFHCLGEKGKVFCGQGCRCPATKVLNKIQKSVWDTLKSMTVRDLAQ